MDRHHHRLQPYRNRRLTRAGNDVLRLLRRYRRRGQRVPDRRYVVRNRDRFHRRRRFRNRFVLQFFFRRRIFFRRLVLGRIVVQQLLFELFLRWRRWRRRRRWIPGGFRQGFLPERRLHFELLRRKVRNQTRAFDDDFLGFDFFRLRYILGSRNRNRFVHQADRRRERDSV